jgi:hypothetical protein
MIDKQFYVGLIIFFDIISKRNGLKIFAGERISKFFAEKKIFYYADFFNLAQ